MSNHRHRHRRDNVDNDQHQNAAAATHPLPFVSPESSDKQFQHLFETLQMTDSNDYDDGEENEFDLLQSLRGLSLPRGGDNNNTIRILCVSQVDLTSAARLAEYALLQNDIGSASIDLLLACGPFSCPKDLYSGNYMQGRQRQQHSTRRKQSREMTAALEGLVTGALSQLESIVCRVLYIPGDSDPSTTMISEEESAQDLPRLTANSHNVHKGWLQLAPGLGCTGLLHDVDSSVDQNDDLLVEDAAAETRSTLTRLLNMAPPTTPPPQYSAPPPYPKPLKFASRFSQAILLTTTTSTSTQNEQEEEQGCHTDESEHVDKEDKNTSTANPFEGYSEWLEAQFNVVLHVTAGKFPFQGQIGNVCTVVPGSLIKGDFCLIDLVLEKERNDENVEYQSNNATRASSRSAFSWRVNRVQFRNMNTNNNRTT